MDIIDQRYVRQFVSFYSSKGGKYSYFSKIHTKKIGIKADIFEYCMNVYKSGIAFQTGKQKYLDWDYKSLVSSISSRIYDYFNQEPNIINNQTNFDIFHTSLCNDFLIISSKSSKAYTYGNAQKYVNMCFKYLVCFLDYCKFSDLFSYCHMPIDSNILEKLFLCGLTGITKVKGTYKYNGLPWTKLNYDQYNNLLSAYRGIISESNPNCSSLNFDFVNWTSKKTMSTPLFTSSGKVCSRIDDFYN